MQLRGLIIALGACAALATAGCGDDGHEATAHATYQACFDTHVEDEQLPVLDAILMCCAEHPIDGARPACGATAPECINYLTANLAQTSASTVEVMDACAQYEAQLGQP